MFLSICCGCLSITIDVLGFYCSIYAHCFDWFGTKIVDFIETTAIQRTFVNSTHIRTHNSIIIIRLRNSKRWLDLENMWKRCDSSFEFIIHLCILLPVAASENKWFYNGEYEYGIISMDFQYEHSFCSYFSSQWTQDTLIEYQISAKSKTINRHWCH